MTAALAMGWAVAPVVQGSGVRLPARAIMLTDPDSSLKGFARTMTNYARERRTRRGKNEESQARSSLPQTNKRGICPNVSTAVTKRGIAHSPKVRRDVIHRRTPGTRPNISTTSSPSLTADYMTAQSTTLQAYGRY